MPKILTLFVGGLVLILTGCGEHLVQVKGKVTVDGVPVDQGLVRFEPIDGNSPSSKGGEIKNGEFTAEVHPGEMKVIIIGAKVVGKRPRYETPDSPTIDILQDIVPAKYSKDSPLKVEIQTNGQELTFALESK